METNRTFTVEVSKLENNPFQPRKHLSPKKVLDLANNIRDVGLMHPICVRQIGDRWQIVFGHRRVAAYRLLVERAKDEETRAKYFSIRAEVRNDVTDSESLKLCLAENLQRDNLEPLEAAEGLANLQHLDERLSDNRALGEAVGISHSHAGKLLKLASAPAYLKEMVDDGAANDNQEDGGQPPSKLSAGAVRELIRGHESLASIPGLVNPQAFATRRVRAVMNRAIKRQWTLPEIRKAVDKLTGERTPTKKVAPDATRAVATLKLNEKNHKEASAPQISSMATKPQSGEAPLPIEAKKSARESLEMAWEVLVLGVAVSVAGGFLHPAIVSTVVTWVGTVISLSGIALLVRTWAPLHQAWTKAFQLGISPVWRELIRKHSEAEQPRPVIHSDQDKAA